MYRILVVGGGYLGQEIAASFVRKKQKVWATTRRAERAEAFKKLGIEPLILDLTKPQSFHEIPSVHFVVLCPAPDENDVKAYEDLYLQGIKNFLLAYPSHARPFLMVYISSTGVWGKSVQGVVDEMILPMPDTEKSKILLAAEEQVLTSGYATAILRLSGIYGPGRNWIHRIRENRLPQQIPDRYANMIHRDDVAEMMPQFFKNAQVGQVYVATDDEPILRSEFCFWLSEKMNFKFPENLFVKTEDVGKRCLNDKLRSLGIELKYPTFREGYQSLLDKNT